jgi:rSAM/selenodomain-associated transferase 2
MLSVVIPTLDTVATLEGTLRSLRSADGFVAEVVVADGGSRDGTVELATRRGARVVACQRGRGHQLAAGAGAATQPWLLFIHADTRLGADWEEEARRFVADPANGGRAGYFHLAFDDPARAARRVERYAAWRSRVFGLPYGDQGLLISRALYDAVGGFRPLALMEDVDLVRRMGRGRLVALAARAVTSAARYRRKGYVRRGTRNLWCLFLYFIGVPPRIIAGLYG